MFLLGLHMKVQIPKKFLLTAWLIPVPQLFSVPAWNRDGLTTSCNRCCRKGMHWMKGMRPGHLTQGKDRKEIMDKAWGNIPLRRGSNLFSNTSRASVPSSIRSSLVITPIVRCPTEKNQTYLIKQLLVFSSVHKAYRLPNLATQGLLN